MNDTALNLSRKARVDSKVIITDDQIDFNKLFAVVWDARFVFLIVLLSVGGVASFIAYKSPNIYRSEALLAPVDDASTSGGAGLFGQIGGLASLAGINLNASASSRASLSLEILKSRSFITSFINRRNILVPLMAANGWDSASGRVLVDASKFDVEKSQWLWKEGESSDLAPSDWEAFSEFSKLLNVNRSKDTGLVRISIDHYSPFVAKEWIEWLIEDINQQVRERDIREANRSIEYLKAELEKTALTGMQQVFYQLIEKQMQTIMLANVHNEYVFNVIDPPVVSEQKVAPKRLIIVFSSLLVAFVVTMIVVLLVHSFRSRVE